MPGAWQVHGLALALALCALAAGFHGTFYDMGRIWWTSSTFNHGFLILPIALYLGWHQRHVAAGMAPGVSWAGVVFVLANSVLWVGGELMSVAFFQHAAVVGMIVGIGWSLLGNRLFRVLLFPFLYLYFAVPEGEFLVPHLQDLTAAVLVKMLRLTGIPVFLEGRYLAIPSGNFVVAEACSGINYLIATLAVGAMFMYLNFRSWWRRLLFMLVAVLVPLIANGLRAYGIVMIAHLSDYRYAMGIDHFIYGWVFFGVVIFALCAIGNYFSDVGDGDRRAPPPPPHAPTRRTHPALVVALLLAVMFAPRGMLAASDRARPLAPPIALPNVPGWEGPFDAQRRLGADFSGADQYLAGTYRDAAGRELTLEIVYYRAEEGDGELINQSNILFDDERWRQLDYGFRAAPPGSVTGEIYSIGLRDAGRNEDYLVWLWYEAHGRRAATRLPIKLAQALARLSGADAGAAAFSVRTRRGEGRDGSAADVLAAFIAHEALHLDRLPRE